MVTSSDFSKATGATVRPRNSPRQQYRFYASGGVPLGPLPGLGCCAHEQLGGYVPVAGWLFHESSSCGVHVKSLLIAAAGAS